MAEIKGMNHWNYLIHHGLDIIKEKPRKNKEK